MEDEEEENGEENGLQGTHPVPNGLANSLPPQLSAVEFRQLADPNSSLRQDPQDQSVLTVVLQSENESPVRPPTSPGAGLMKRRNSNLANCEKMLQEMNAFTSDTSPARKRKESVGAYEAILEFADEVNEENDKENSEKAQSCHGNDPSENQTNEHEPDGVKKPEDPNHALLQYFATLSSSVGVDDSLDLEHIQSLLHEGASVNTSDRFGQTLLHEVSRTWGVDVAQFFIEKGKANKLLV